MTSKVIYKGGLETECIHLKSNDSIRTDAPIDNNGKELHSHLQISVPHLWLRACLLSWVFGPEIMRLIWMVHMLMLQSIWAVTQGELQRSMLICLCQIMSTHQK